MKYAPIECEEHVILNSKAGKYVILYTRVSRCPENIMHKYVSNIYIHYFVCTSQHKNALKHIHCHKDVTVLSSYIFQVSIIYDKNGTDNPNGKW